MTKHSLSIFQYGFCKKYSTQHALIAMTEKVKKVINKGGTFGDLLTDFLSRAFDFMTHEFLLAKHCALNLIIDI